jgi:hypothetical protein
MAHVMVARPERVEPLTLRSVEGTTHILTFDDLDWQVTIIFREIKEKGAI